MAQCYANHKNSYATQWNAPKRPIIGDLTFHFTIQINDMHDKHVLFHIYAT